MFTYRLTIEGFHPEGIRQETIEADSPVSAVIILLEEDDNSLRAFEIIKIERVG